MDATGILIPLLSRSLAAPALAPSSHRYLVYLRSKSFFDAEVEARRAAGHLSRDLEERRSRHSLAQLISFGGDGRRLERYERSREETAAELLRALEAEWIGVDDADVIAKGMLAAERKSKAAEMHG